MDGACELGTGSIPLVSGLEGDVGGRVVDDCEGAHPEVVAQPWHEPEFDKAKPAGVVYKCRQHCGHEECARCNADLDLQHTRDPQSIARLKKTSFASFCRMHMVLLNMAGVAVAMKNAHAAILILTCGMQ